MPASNRLEGNLFVTGNFAATSMTLPDGCVKDSSVQGNAKIASSKLEHQHRVPYSQPNSAAAAETRAIYRCYGVSGAIVAFHAGSIAPCTGGATITVDLRKNGATVLTAPITLNNANAARVAVAGTLAATTLAAGDVLEVVVTATAGGGTIGTGLFAFATVSEDAQ